MAIEHSSILEAVMTTAQRRRYGSTTKEFFVSKTLSNVRGHLKTLDDAKLVTAYLEGEVKAFDELVDRYQSRLLNFIFRMIGDKEKSEDLVQEVFMRVYRNIHHFNLEKKFSTWIFTIASNLAKNEYRDQSRDPLIYEHRLKRDKHEKDDRILEFVAISKDPLRELVNKEYAFLIEKALSRLPEARRRMFILRDIQGLSYAEISEITGTKIGTVKSQLNRARIRFAEIIGPMLN